MIRLAFYTVEEFKENIADSGITLDGIKETATGLQPTGDNALPEDRPQQNTLPEGERPDRNQMPEVGVKEIRNNFEGNRSTISIVDYIRLRLANI